MNWRKILYITCAVTIVLGLAIYGGCITYDYYRRIEYPCLTKEKHNNNDTITVQIIGDSWAAYHLPHDQELTLLLSKRTGKHIMVKSHGIVGAKTKHIYAALYDTRHGFGNSFNTPPDYCIISAGINDAIAGMGTDNYYWHYERIIMQLLAWGTTPIVLDMPDVNYQAVRKRESLLTRTRHSVSCRLTGSSFPGFTPYRKALKDMLNKKGLRQQVIYIPSTKWNAMGYKDKRHLYLSDDIHLNTNGYRLLDSCIAESMINQVNSKFIE